MRPHRLLAAASLALIVAALPGCSATSLESSWRNPHFAAADGPFHKVMVIVVSNDGTIRRKTEDAFLAQLASRGREAIASYTLLPQDAQVPEDQIREVVRQSGADAVIAARLIDRSKETTTFTNSFSAGQTPSYTSYYSSGWSPSSSSSAYTYDVFTIESRFYQVSPETLLWSGTTKTSDPGDADQEIQSFAKIICNELGKQGLLPAAPKK